MTKYRRDGGLGRRFPGSGDALASRQCTKGRPEEDKPPVDTKRRGRTISGEEEARQRGTRGQGLET